MLPTHAPAPNGGALEHATSALTHDQLALIKRTIAYGATDDELALFVHTARRLGLDPLARQIHFVKRRRRTPDGRWEDYGVIQVGIDGLRAVAERTGKYAGQLGPYWCDADGEWRDVWLASTPPVAAKVGVLRSDFREPLWAVARYSAYVQTDSQGRPTSMWSKMADLMLAKCAEALALRKAFPQDLSGIYAPEEMMQADTGMQQEDAHVAIAPSPRVTLPPVEETTKTLGELRNTDERARMALKAIWAAAREKNMTNDDVHALASRVTGREIESCNDLTLDEARELYRAIKQREVVVQTPPVAPSSPPPPAPPKTGWSAWIEEHRNHIVLGTVIGAIERRHIDPDDLCAYVYGASAPATDEQSQAIIEDLAARWAQYVASYNTQSQSQEA